MKKKIILISGPTASGKSSLANSLAKKIDGEIINTDSIQIYRDLKILTARPQPTKSDPIHHLYGFLSGDKLWSVGKWIGEAKKISDQILNKKKIPILVGGTGLYFKAITDGLSPIPEIQISVRKKLIEKLNKVGIEKIYEELKKIDKTAYNIINKNDQQRILRAIEVFQGTGVKISDYWKKDRIKVFADNFMKIKLSSEREALYKNCDDRCEEMFLRGAIEEVIFLNQKKYNESAPIFNAIGVREINDFLLKKVNIEEAKRLIKYRTHQYAKRQITWINHQMVSWKSFSTQESDKIIQYFIKKL